MSSAPLSYAQALLKPAVEKSSVSEEKKEDESSKEIVQDVNSTSNSKRKKKKKSQESVNKTKEQPKKKKPKPTKTLDILDFANPKPVKPKPKNETPANKSVTVNPASSETITVKRGKERMVPKQKKFTKLKKVILLDREQKYKSKQEENGEKGKEEEEENADSIESEEEENADETNEMTKDEENAEELLELQKSSAQRFQELAKLPKIPVTEPREYVTQIMTEELNKQVQFLISELTRFYQRQKKLNPTKAKRRYISGLNEVLRGVQRKKVKCLIVAPNIDNVSSPGGLDDITNELLKQCRKMDIPVIFALSRRGLGRACGKNHARLSVIGILNYDGTNEVYNSIVKLVKEGKKKYEEEKKAKAKENIEVVAPKNENEEEKKEKQENVNNVQ